MCGIAGTIAWERSTPGDSLLGAISRMTGAVAHRGPDDSGYWIDDQAQVALGHRRLSILDLSPEGHQPMMSVHRRYRLVFNGEIYNYQHLRRSLAGKGHRFRGTSDTEVMLAAFEEFGFPGALERLNGMFAFALWDQQERLLHLACDRFGEKPLYYGIVNGWLLFGSELKSLRAHPGFTAGLDRDALALYLQFGYVPAPHSIYQGVAKLPPATSVTFDVGRRRRLPIETYWSGLNVAAAASAVPIESSPAEAVDRLNYELGEAVKSRMIADVPVGAFLSGGVDSSTIVALMQRVTNRQVKTFTIGLGESSYNEAAEAGKVARHLETDHTERYVTATDAMSVIPRLSTMYDEPFGDSSQIPTFLVSQLARQSVTVALSGDGGDELFGGYNRHVWANRFWQQTRRVPRPLRRALGGSLSSMGPGSWDRLGRTLAPALPSWCRVRQPGNKIQKLAAALWSDSPDAMYLNLVSQWTDATALVPGSQAAPTPLTNFSQWPSSFSFCEQMMMLDLLTYLPGDILVKVDRAAMAVGLETRVPFLDPELLKFAWQLPLNWKIRQNQGKWLLRQVLYRYVPAPLVDRPKSGFGIPLGDWLRGPLRNWADDLLSAATLTRQGYLQSEPVQQRWREHLNGSRNWEQSLWTVLMFQAWLQQAESFVCRDEAAALAPC